MQTTTRPEQVTRECRCGGIAVGIELTETPCHFGISARTIDVKVRCTRCNSIFNARVGRNEEREYAEMEQIEYYRRRKDWARELLSEHDLTKPGDSIRDKFEGIELRVWIGPRGGVRIDGPKPWEIIPEDDETEDDEE